eukprot:3819834-Amphidinium_carterae.1
MTSTQVRIAKSLLSEGGCCQTPEEIACVIEGELIPTLGAAGSAAIHQRFEKLAVAVGQNPETVSRRQAE